jgi:3-phenylpropionate/trans-cinnamate dioxygenase ferredoxin reductase subunit
MKKYKYLIIGGGMTGDSAVKGIREIDKEGSIGIVSRENHPPYSRPPLTKDLWKGGNIEKIWRGTDKLGAELLLGTIIKSIDTKNHKAIDETGEGYGYEKLLLATGGIPKRLPFGGDDIIYYRLYSDYERVSSFAKKVNKFTVIGGGFIGTEIAAALAMNGKEVTIIFPEKYIGQRVFPIDLAEFVTYYYEQKSVNLKKEFSITSTEKKNGELRIKTSPDGDILSEAVIAGIGIKPDMQLALDAGIKVENGILVDENLMTSAPDVYAAGDVANFYNPHLDKRIRIEHADNANKMGKHAGQSMAGDMQPFNYLPYFYSDMFDLGYEAIGELDSSYETYSDWQERFRKGIIYYLKENKVRGVLLWNVWGKVNDARELIGSKKQVSTDELKGKIA